MSCTTPVGIWLFLLSSNFTSVRSGHEWSTPAIYGQELHSLHFLILIVQRHLHSFVGDELFFTLQRISHRWNIASLSWYYSYFYGKGSDELHSLISSDLTVMAKTHHSTHIVVNLIHPLGIPLVKCSPLQQLLMNTLGDPSPIRTFLTRSSLELTFIFQALL